jgi:predicted ATPase
MIRQIRIKNYKSLKNINVSLGQLAVIFGPNAAGKSNLFDALNLLSRLVTKKNLKEAFEGHRGLPIEAVRYEHGNIRDLLSTKTHTISFSVDVELSDAVISEVETRIKELRQGIEKKPEEAEDKAKITNHLLRYDLEIEVISSSGQLRVMNERLSALRKSGKGEKARNAFIEKMGNKLNLRMEGQAHPTHHEIGLDYTIVSTALYPPHHPHITAFREEMSRCHFYYFEPRTLMRAGNGIAEVSNLGPQGEDLAAFYHTLSLKQPEQFKALKLAARQVLPRLEDIDVEPTEKAELFLRILENGAYYSNRLISEGTLRVLGLLAVLSPSSKSTTIGYEEPENGVHPRRLQLIAEMLKNASNEHRQILINTHSPVLPGFFKNRDLLKCQRSGTATTIEPFTSLGDLFRGNEIEENLEEQILRGDYGG